MSSHFVPPEEYDIPQINIRDESSNLDDHRYATMIELNDPGPSSRNMGDILMNSMAAAGIEQSEDSEVWENANVKTKTDKAPRSLA